MAKSDRVRMPSRRRIATIEAEHAKPQLVQTHKAA